MVKPASFLLRASSLGLLFGLVACQSTSHKPAYAPAPPAIKYNSQYDWELKDIFDLANKGEWEKAEIQVNALAAKAPKDNSVLRLKDWIAKQQQIQREQAVENKIREIDAKNSVFNPTIPDLLKEKKDRGLPARKDVRDTVDKIESAPYIPETYGKTVREKGPLFDLDSAKPRMAKNLEKEVTIHLDNVPLEAVILYISQTNGINIVADKSLPALKQLLSVNLDKVSLGEFLRYIERNYELQFQVGNELVWVTDGKDPKKLMEETRFYRLRKGFVLPAVLEPEETLRVTTVAGPVTTTTETQKLKKFVNDGAPAMPSIERAITNLFTGKYFIDYERNLIVARGTPQQLDVMEKVILEFDQPIQQVLIEARFVTISKPAFLQLGAIWEMGRSSRPANAPNDFTGLMDVSRIPSLGIGVQETFTNILGRSTLSATISALEQSGESQTLSAPRLTVLNNRPATISDGKVQYYYEQYTVKTTTGQYFSTSAFVPEGKPTKITGGAELAVLASISGDGKSIILALNPRVNTDVKMVQFATLTDTDSQGRKSSFDINLPQYRTEELATRVVIKSGETVVMGGILERDKSTYVESVPVLGNLPILGALFRRRTEVDRPRYLLVFVTATILKETGEFLIYEDEPAVKK